MPENQEIDPWENQQPEQDPWQEQDPWESETAANIEPEITVQAPPDVSRSEALVRGAGQVLGDYPVKGYAAIKSYIENKKYEDEFKKQKLREEQASAQYPLEYYGAPFITGMGAEASMGKIIPAIKEIPNVIKAATAGGVYQSSKADKLEDIPEETLKGMAAGATGYGAAKAAGTAAQGLFSGLMSVSPQILEKVNKNPSLLYSNEVLDDVGNSLQEGILKLKNKAIEASQSAMDELPPDAQIDVKPFVKKFDDLIAKYSSASVPEAQTTANYLTKFKNNFLNKTKEATSGDKYLTAQALKDEIKLLDPFINWDIKSGDFSGIDNAARIELRRSWDQTLKDKYPEYRQAMEKEGGVADLFGILNNVKNNFGVKETTGQQMDTLKSKLAKTVLNPDLHQGKADVLKSLDKALGTDYTERTIAATVNQVFSGEGRTQGSARTLAMGSIGTGIAKLLDLDPVVVGAAMAALGKTLDVKGPQMARGILKGKSLFPGVGSFGPGVAGSQALGPLMPTPFSNEAQGFVKDDMIKKYLTNNKMPEKFSLPVTPTAEAKPQYEAFKQYQDKEKKDLESAVSHYVRMNQDPAYRQKVLEE